MGLSSFFRDVFRVQWELSDDPLQKFQEAESSVERPCRAGLPRSPTSRTGPARTRGGSVWLSLTKPVKLSWDCLWNTGEPVLFSKCHVILESRKVKANGVIWVALGAEESIGTEWGRSAPEQVSGRLDTAAFIPTVVLSVERDEGRTWAGTTGLTDHESKTCVSASQPYASSLCQIQFAHFPEKYGAYESHCIFMCVCMLFFLKKTSRYDWHITLAIQYLCLSRHGHTV